MFPNQIISACQANLTLLTKCNDPTKLPWLKLGLLGEDLIAAHAIHLNDEEMERLSHKGVRIVHVPESNMKLSKG